MAFSRYRANEPPLPDALAYLITWPTYGTWLPGDKRGWVEYHMAGNSLIPFGSSKPKLG